MDSEAQTQCEAAAAERIIARAGVLQDTHRQTLSREQIETIAAEVGIRSEFVHRAIEQEKHEKAGSLAVNQRPAGEKQSRHSHLTGPRITATTVACAIVAASFVAVSRGSYDGLVYLLYLCVFPLMLSLLMGVMWGSRRRGAVAGIAIALTSIATCMLISVSKGENPYPTWDDGGIQIFSTALASSTLIGAAGAQGRRITSHLRAAKRKRVNQKP